MLTAHVLHAVCVPATSWNVPLPQLPQVGVAVAVHVPLNNIPVLQLVVQLLQAVLLPATSWKVPPVHAMHEPVVVPLQLPVRY